MTSRPADPWRREMGAGCLAFLVAFFGVAVGIIYLTIRYGIPEQGRWAIAHGLWMLLKFPLLGGFGLAAAVVVSLERWHYYRGLYHCQICGRTLKRGIPCECLPDDRRNELLKASKRRSKWRHYRKRIPAALATHVVLLALALPLALHLNRGTFLFDLLMAQVLLCVAILIVMGFTVETLELLKRGKRLRKRWRVFAPLIGLWPVIFIFTMAALTWAGVA